MAALLPLADPRAIGRQWHHTLLALFFSMLWIAFWYRETAISMLSIWQRSDTFAHGYLVVPIAGWLIWRKRHEITCHIAAPSLGLLPFVAFAGLIWLVGELAAANSVTQAAFVALLTLTAPLLLGWPVARCIAFPLCFLFFTVPTGEFLLPQLMEWTASFTVFALRLIGVPVYREGLNFVIPSGRWSVIEACSGMRYLIASLMVGSLYAYLSYQSMRRRFLFIAAALVIPVVANWLRAFMIVMIAHLSNNRIATGVDHLLYGWAFFGFVMLLMFWLGTRWTQSDPSLALPIQALTNSHHHRNMPGNLTRLWLITSVMACLSALPLAANWLIERNSQNFRLSVNQSRAATHSLPAPITLHDEWTLQDSDAKSSLPAFKPSYQHPSFELQGTYVANSATVGLYVAGYQQQGKGHALVSSENVLVQSQDPHWMVTSRGAQNSSIGGSHIKLGVSSLRRVDISDSLEGGRLRVWHIKWMSGVLVQSDFEAKALGVFRRLTGQSDDAAVIVMYTRESRTGEGDATLEKFWVDSYGSIDAFLSKRIKLVGLPAIAPAGLGYVDAKKVVL